MFTFKIFEIPDGKSNRKLILTETTIDLGEVTLKQAEIVLEFEKTSRFIRVTLNIDADIHLICDRSLEPFLFHVQQPYEILFKYNNQVDSEDEHGAIRNIDSRKNEINIKQDVLDTILVHLPAKKLHPRFLDDKGNATEFKTQSFGNFCTEFKTQSFGNFCDEDFIDPRWAALKDLKK